MFQTYRVLLMGVPTMQRVDGLSQAGAVHDWISAKDVHEVYYSGFGDKFEMFVNKVAGIREEIINNNQNTYGKLSALFGNTWPRFYNTVSKQNKNIILGYKTQTLDTGTNFSSKRVWNPKSEMSININKKFSTHQLVSECLYTHLINRVIRIIAGGSSKYLDESS